MNDQTNAEGNITAHRKIQAHAYYYLHNAEVSADTEGAGITFYKAETVNL